MLNFYIGYVSKSGKASLLSTAPEANHESALRERLAMISVREMSPKDVIVVQARNAEDAQDEITAWFDMANSTGEDLYGI